MAVDITVAYHIIIAAGSNNSFSFLLCLVAGGTIGFGIVPTVAAAAVVAITTRKQEGNLEEAKS